MTAFFDEMAELAVELVGPNSDFGEPFTITRPAAVYDKATRKASTAPARSQVCWGSDDTSLKPVSGAGSMVSKHEKELTVVPAAVNGFEPGQNDRVTTMDGSIFVVSETAHVVKSGRPIVWVMGLDGV